MILHYYGTYFKIAFAYLGEQKSKSLIDINFALSSKNSIFIVLQLLGDPALVKTSNLLQKYDFNDLTSLARDMCTTETIKSNILYIPFAFLVDITIPSLVDVVRILIAIHTEKKILGVILFILDYKFSQITKTNVYQEIGMNEKVKYRYRFGNIDFYLEGFYHLNVIDIDEETDISDTIFCISDNVQIMSIVNSIKNAQYVLDNMQVGETFELKAYDESEFNDDVLDMTQCDDFQNNGAMSNLVDCILLLANAGYVIYAQTLAIYVAILIKKDSESNDTNQGEV